jgi:ABC-type phosphate transport system substrate-binding protein
VIIPVAQTSIAVVANIPSACALKSEKGLTYAELNSLFAGTISKWSSLSNVASKAACEVAETGPIVRVVREDGSGTSFQFKNYLSVLETTEAASGPGKFGASCTTKKWSELRTTGEPNLTWPEATCNTGATALHRVSGGGALAEYVAATPNTIGYVAYSDAVAHNAKPLELQNATGKTITYAAPGKVPSGGTNPTEANCSSRVYTVPAAGRAGSGTGLGVDWSAVFGAAPTAGGTLYPLCTLTYDVAWNGYSTVGYTEGAKVGEAVHSYLGYVLNEGQSILGTLGYQTLPETVAAENNVLGAAKLALSKVN